MTSVVTNPQAGDVHVNTPLTNFAQKYLQDEASFVATKAFPNTPVTKQSDLYYVFDKDDFFRDDAEERADGTESAGGAFDLSTDPYFARVYAFHKDLTDRQRANEDTPVQLEQSASQYVTQKLLIRRERLFQAAFFATGLWTNELTGNATASSTQFVFWSASGSDPIKDIRAAKEAVQVASGLRPNKMLIGRRAYDTLLDNDAVLDRISGGATTAMPALVLKQKLAEILELEAIFVMDSIVTTSQKGDATPSREFIGGDNALLYYAPNAVGLEEPTAGVQFSWTGLLGNTPNGLRIKRFRMEHLESDRIEGQMAFDYKLTAPDLGFFFADCTA